jgi:hypothetical protein
VLSKAAAAAELMRRTYRRYRDERTILVYQMGKVGSVSIADALGERAIQIHNFFPSNEPCSKRPFYRSALYKWPRDWLFYMTIRRAVRARRLVKIVSVVRDPVARNVSMYFHDLYYWLAFYFTEVRPERVSTEGPNALIDCFRETFDHNYPLEWFDRELKRLTGLDVYDYEFDRARGWTRIDRGGVSLLIVQTERLRDCWPALEEFCDTRLEWREDNRSDQKWYGSLYSEFVARYSVSAPDLDRIYSSRYASFFFSEKDRAAFRRRWGAHDPFVATGSAAASCAALKT